MSTQNSSETKRMTLLDAIRTLRKEKGMDFEDAKRTAVAFFVSKGWELPAWAIRYTRATDAPSSRA